MLFIFLALVLSTLSNWNQKGYNERFTYQSPYISKMKEGWEVKLDGFEEGASQSYTLIDDNNGLLWFGANFYSQNLGAALDLESGDVVHSTYSLNCSNYDECGSNPVLTTDGNLILFNDDLNEIFSVKPDGSIGWTYQYDHKKHMIIHGNGAYDDATEMFVFSGSVNRVSFFEGISVGETKPRYMVNMTDMFDDIGTITVFDSRVYFTCSREDFSGNLPFYIFDIETGKLLTMKTINISGGEFSGSKLAIHSELEMIYFSNVIISNGSVVVYGMDLRSLKDIWRSTIVPPKYLDLSCSSLLLSQKKILVSCSDQYVGHSRPYYWIIDAKTGKIDGMINFEGKEYNGCYIDVLIGENTSATICDEDLIILDLDKVTWKVVKNQQPEPSSFLGDASGCVYLCFRERSERDNKCKKMCLL